MTTARDIMSTGVSWVSASDTVLYAAKRMAADAVGSLPIRGEDGNLQGMITDRDIVVKVLAAGKDPQALHAGEIAQDQTLVTIGPDDDAAAILRTMAEHQVRRVPVMDGDELVGIVAQADVARALDNPSVGELVEALSTD